jgi:hypothetical protein
MTNAGKEWIEVGTFDTTWRIRKIEGYPVTGVCHECMSIRGSAPMRKRSEPYATPDAARFPPATPELTMVGQHGA